MSDDQDLPSTADPVPPWRVGTRVVHAGLPAPEAGAPLMDGPVFAAPYHLPGPADASPYGYARYANPTWTALELALGQIEDAESVVFPSGMGAMAAVVLGLLHTGDKLVTIRDGYPGIRDLATRRLEPNGIDVQLVDSRTEDVIAAAAGATMVWVESPANPGLEILDLQAVADAAHAAGALLAVDNTLATPLGQRPLDLGADLAMLSGTKALTGHSDLLLGSVATRDPELAEALRMWRANSGATLGPMEAWLAHRSLATLSLRLDRQCTSSLLIAQALVERGGSVTDVRHPGLPDHPQHELAARQMRRLGPLLAFTLPDAEHAQRFLSGARLVAEATSFGGVHTIAERRARWGTDAVADGFIRLSAGCEDPEDLLADILSALDRADRG